MAQVTMDSKEFLELIDKERKLEAVEQLMLDNVYIKFDDNYNGYAIQIIPTFTAQAKQQMLNKVVAGLLTQEKVMEKLVRDSSHVLDLGSGYISYKWRDQIDPWEVDLWENKEFKAEWDRLKEIQAENQEEEL